MNAPKQARSRRRVSPSASRIQRRLGRLACLGVAWWVPIRPIAGQGPAAPPGLDPTTVAVAQAQIDAATEALLRFPPGGGPLPRERRMALLLLDAAVAASGPAGLAPVQEFYQLRTEEALNEIEAAEVASGARLWRFYNHGFVIRTGTVVLGFDLIRASGRGGSDFQPFYDYQRRLARACDALFITTAAEDHADPIVARLFVEAGKPVLGPTGLWAGERWEGGLRRAPGAGSSTLAFSPRPGAEVKAHVIAGPAGCLWSVVTPEGLRIVHAGDLPAAGGPPSMASTDGEGVDLVFLDARVADPDAWLAALRPGLIIPGHEHELGAPAAERAYYAQTFSRLRRAREPVAPLAWGESLAIPAPAAPATDGP